MATSSHTARRRDEPSQVDSVQLTGLGLWRRVRPLSFQKKNFFLTFLNSGATEKIECCRASASPIKEIN